MFRLLGMLDEPSVGVPLVAALLDEIPSVAEAALERLVDVRLAEDAGPGRCRLRELLWLFAMQKTGNDHPVKLSDLTDNPGVLDTVRARLGIVHARSGTPASRF